jgi:uncharacterized RDD family membrane protein YckC
LLDLIIILSMTIISLLGNEKSRLFGLKWLMFSLWFHVYLVKRYGSTPEKVILEIKITKLDRSNIGYKEAILRYSLWILFL